PQGPPLFPAFIRLLPPAHDREFLILPAYDRLPGPKFEFGLHRETVVTACMIVACNRPGYLSKFRNPQATQIDVASDLLLPGKYYYHLDDTKAGELYPICRDFQSWRFPHGKIPASWSAVSSTENQNWPSNWTALSQKIKDRDATCLISGATDSLT